MALGGTVTDVSVGEGGALAAHPVRSQNSSIASCDGFNTACTRSSNSAKAASRAANCFARLRTARKASTVQMWTPPTQGGGGCWVQRWGFGGPTLGSRGRPPSFGSIVCRASLTAVYGNERWRTVAVSVCRAPCAFRRAGACSRGFDALLRVHSSPVSPRTHVRKQPRASHPLAGKMRAAH